MFYKQIDRIAITPVLSNMILVMIDYSFMVRFYLGLVHCTLTHAVGMVTGLEYIVIWLTLDSPNYIPFIIPGVNNSSGRVISFFIARLSHSEGQ